MSSQKQAHTELSKSLEEYLKIAHELEIESGAAAPSDIADRLGVKAPSVTSALRRLRDLGLIEYEPYSSVKLTDTGKLKANELALRKQILVEFLTLIGVDDEIASEDACEIEHLLNQKTIQKLMKFLVFLKNDLNAKKALRKFSSGKSE
jgi:Mn-dependent DtxR family transcriptional regulator